jgi:hypothetical protein
MTSGSAGRPHHRISHWKIRGLDKKVPADFQLQGTTCTLWRDYAYRDGVLLAAFSPQNRVRNAG